MTSTDALFDKQISTIREAQSTQIQLSGYSNAYVIYRYVGSGIGAPAYQNSTVSGYRDHINHKDNEIVATVLTNGEVVYPEAIVGSTK